MLTLAAKVQTNSWQMTLKLRLKLNVIIGCKRKAAFALRLLMNPITYSNVDDRFGRLQYDSQDKLSAFPLIWLRYWWIFTVIFALINC